MNLICHHLNIDQPPFYLSIDGLYVGIEFGISQAAVYRFDQRRFAKFFSDR